MQFLYGQASLQYVYTSEYVVVYRLEGGHLWSRCVGGAGTKTRITVLRTEQAKKEKAGRGASVMGVRSMKYKACSRDMHME